MRAGWVFVVSVAVLEIVAACGGRTEQLIYEDDEQTQAGRAVASGGGGRGPVAVGGTASGRGGRNPGAGAGQGGRAMTGASGTGPGGMSAGGAMGVGGMVSAGGAGGTPTACFDDSDCPGPRCGGEVCNWTKFAPMPEADKIFLCNPAGTDPQGRDGWCMIDADCKCFAQGARCVAPYCTFTRP